jgi:hypothetical protein
MKLWRATAWYGSNESVTSPRRQVPQAVVRAKTLGSAIKLTSTHVMGAGLAKPEYQWDVEDICYVHGEEGVLDLVVVD